MRILVTEKLAESGLDLLRDAGHEVDVSLGLSPDELCEAIVGAHGLIIRSATQVTAEVFEASDVLQVVGRAGVGLDNVDTDAATAAGVIVANAPTSNSVSAAEHTLAMLLAVARNVPQAHAALTNGRWERSNWGGVELMDKTLGIVGLGNIGGIVAVRAKAFGMRLIGHDPFVSPERASELGVELMGIDELVAEADFLTLHLARTPDTVNLINAERLTLAKPPSDRQRRTRRHHQRGRSRRGHLGRHDRWSGDRRIRQRTQDRVTAFRPAPGRCHPAPWCEHF